MSTSQDQRLRAAERRWRETGAVEDEASFLLERVRCGDIAHERLELAAFCGHPGACAAYRHHAQAAPTLVDWMNALGRRWPRALGAAGRIATEPCLEVWRRAYPQDERPALALARLAESLAHPHDEARRAVAVEAGLQSALAGNDREGPPYSAAHAIYQYVQFRPHPDRAGCDSARGAC